MTIQEFIDGTLAPYLGQNFDDVSDQLGAVIDASPFVWRWLEPTTDVSPNEVREDRVNVNVDLIHTITSFTVG
jgi:hypothetical protein